MQSLPLLEPVQAKGTPAKKVNSSEEPSFDEIPPKRTSDLDQLASLQRSKPSRIPAPSSKVEKAPKVLAETVQPAEIRLKQNSGWFTGPIDKQGKLFDSSERNV